MKKKLCFSLSVLCCLFMCLSGCNKTQTVGTQEPLPESKPEITAESLIAAISDLENFGESIIYDENNDVNELLGRPNQYIGKVDFSDKRCEQYGEYLVGGTFEIFSSEKDCNSRHTYLLQFTDPSLGAFGLHQYIYKYSNVILRIEYDLTSSQAEEYRDKFTEYIGEEPEQNY